MWKFAAGMIGAAALAGMMAGSLQTFAPGDATSGAQPQNEAANTAPQPKKVSKSSESFAGRNVRIKGDRRGHFTTNARMNGRQVEVLVDTGATSVAINKSTARRLGIRLSASDYKYTVNTANGTVKAASAVIDRIEIGRVSVANVRAAVLPDKSLKGTLLGMSFLGQLRSFEIRSGELVLTQ